MAEPIELIMRLRDQLWREYLGLCSKLEGLDLAIRLMNEQSNG